MSLVPPVKDGDWNSIRRAIQQLASIKLGQQSTPLFSGLTISGLTASRLIATGASKQLASVTNLASWVAGVANEIDVADDGDGTITIGLVDPLAVSKGGTGQSSYTDGQLLIGKTTGNTLNKAALTGTSNQVIVTNGDGIITLSAPQDLHTGASPSFVRGIFTELTLSPFAITSTVLNINLNADLLDGHHSSDFLTSYSETDPIYSANSYAVGMNQLVATSSSPTFAGLTVTDYIKFDNVNYLTLLGYQAGGTTPRLNNTLIGYQAGYNLCGTSSQGTRNVYIGEMAGYGNPTLNKGFENVAIGKESLYYIATGAYNMAIGTAALYSDTTGSWNIALGYSSLYYNTIGEDNVAVGVESLLLNTQGNRNTAIGVWAGNKNTTGSDNVFIGFQAGYRQTTLGNRLIIDNRDRTTAALEITNSLIYGVFAADPANQTLRFNAAVTATSLLLSGLTASQITGTDASKNLVSLAVATYPSLTELSYVKGVTSAIQTQLGAKLALAGGTMTGLLEARDHGTAATDEVVNICYGEGDPPTANTTTIGTLYIKYTA